MPLINLNDTNGAAPELLAVAQIVRAEWKKDIIGAEFGIAYGGGVEGIGLLWKGVGTIHGYDTFEGHPDYLAASDPDLRNGTSNFAARCMDYWYQDNVYGTANLSYEYQRSELDKQGLDNVILHKGLVTPQTDVSDLPYLNYAFLDLDIPMCMKDAYHLIKDKLLVNAFLCLHDVVPKSHIEGLNEWYEEIKSRDGFVVHKDLGGNMLAILRKQ